MPTATATGTGLPSRSTYTRFWPAASLGCWASVPAAAWGLKRRAALGILRAPSLRAVWKVTLAVMPGLSLSSALSTPTSTV